MNRAVKSLVVAGVMMLPTISLADDGFSYSYVEGSVVEGDGVYDGFAAKGSFGFTDNFHGFVKYDDLDDSFGADTDVTLIEVGFGFNQSLSSNVDLVGTISYVDVDADFNPGDFSENGIAVRGLLRGRVGSNFELEGGLGYTDISQIPADTSVIIGGRYYVTPAFAVGADVETTDGLEELSVNFRYNFGN